MHLFVSYAHFNLCHFFSSSWCQGLAAISACGSSWTFLFVFLRVPNLAISVCYGSKQESYLVANPKGRVSRDLAHMLRAYYECLNVFLP